MPHAPIAEHEGVASVPDLLAKDTGGSTAAALPAGPAGSVAAGGTAARQPPAHAADDVDLGGSSESGPRTPKVVAAVSADSETWVDVTPEDDGEQASPSERLILLTDAEELAVEPSAVRDPKYPITLEGLTRPLDPAQLHDPSFAPCTVVVSNGWPLRSVDDALYVLTLIGCSLDALQPFGLRKVSYPSHSRTQRGKGMLFIELRNQEQAQHVAQALDGVSVRAPARRRADDTDARRDVVYTLTAHASRGEPVRMKRAFVAVGHGLRVLRKQADGGGAQ